MNNNKTLLNIVFGISVGGLVVLAIVMVGLTNDLRIDIDKIRNGDVFDNSISAEKLADDVFSTVELKLENGETVDAKLINASIQDVGVALLAIQ